MKELNEGDFAEATLSERAIVDFFTTRCAPCRHMVPVITEVESMRPDIAFFKVNAEANSDLAVRYGIRAVPTFIVLTNGQVKCQRSGTMTPTQMNHWIGGCLETREIRG